MLKWLKQLLPERTVYKPLPRFNALKQLISYLDEDLTLEERNLCTGFLLQKLEALPIKGIIEATEDGLTINGHLVDIDKARQLREWAKAALDNQALTLIADQVTWIAIQRGLLNGDTPEKLHFYRAAIWFCAQLKEHLQILAQQGQEPDL